LVLTPLLTKAVFQAVLVWITLLIQAQNHIFSH